VLIPNKAGARQCKMTLIVVIKIFIINLALQPFLDHHLSQPRVFYFHMHLILLMQTMTPNMHSQCNEFCTWLALGLHNTKTEMLVYGSWYSFLVLKLHAIIMFLQQVEENYDLLLKEACSYSYLLPAWRAQKLLWKCHMLCQCVIEHISYFTSLKLFILYLMIRTKHWALVLYLVNRAGDS